MEMSQINDIIANINIVSSNELVQSIMTLLKAEDVDYVMSCMSITKYNEIQKICSFELSIREITCRFDFLSLG